MSAWLTELAWRQPLWAWLALYPWLVWALRGWLGRRAGQGYADPQLAPWVRVSAAKGLSLSRRWRNGWRPAALALAWALFALSLAGPRLVQNTYGQPEAEYPQLMVVLDLSRSMTARDVAPSRLQRARLELLDLIDRSGRLRIGLTVFAARPHLLTPVTADKAVLRHALPALRYGLLPTEGSDLAAALAFAADNFADASTPRAVLLVSDGDSGAAGDAARDEWLADAVTQLRLQGITLHVLGMGTTEGAALQGADGGWLQYRGQAVVSRLQAPLLRRLARLGGGRYAEQADTDTEWHELYDRGISEALGGARDEGELVVWRELYPWLLVPAVLLLLLAHGLLAHARPRRVAAGMAPLLLALTGVSTLLPSPPTQAADPQQLAYRAYADQAYARARQAYAGVPGYAGRMGEGNSAYHLGEYRYALQQFTLAILAADDDGRCANALFNLANSHYRMAHYSEAAQLYRDVLRYRPHDAAAERNLAFAETLQAQQGDAAEDDAAGGQGRGPRTARLPQGTDTEGSDVMLDDSQDEESVPVGGRVADLVESGIRYARPAVRQVEVFEDRAWAFRSTSNDRIAQQAGALKVDESTVWQRLFEAEEGFPAPLDAPRELGEVPPW